MGDTDMKNDKASSLIREKFVYIEKLSNWGTESHKCVKK